MSGQVLTIALRLAFDYGDVGREVGVVVGLGDRDRVFELAAPVAPVSLAWQYADHAANDAQPRDVEVDRVIARLFTERAKQEAVRLNREGRYEDARHALEGVRKRIRAYAGSDPMLRGLDARARRAGGDLRGADAGDGPQAARTTRPASRCGCGAPDGKSQRR